KTLFTKRQGGEPAVVCAAADERDEAEWIAGEFARLAAESDLAYEGMAVLYRTNAQSRPLEEAFRFRGIPYRLIGAVSFYERRGRPTPPRPWRPSSRSPATTSTSPRKGWRAPSGWTTCASWSPARRGGRKSPRPARRATGRGSSATLRRPSCSYPRTRRPAPRRALAWA